MVLREDTKAEFIEPLFEALGWDVGNTENDDEVFLKTMPQRIFLAMN